MSEDIEFTTREIQCKEDFAPTLDEFLEFAEIRYNGTDDELVDYLENKQGREFSLSYSKRAFAYASKYYKKEYNHSFRTYEKALVLREIDQERREEYVEDELDELSLDSDVEEPTFSHDIESENVREEGWVEIYERKIARSSQKEEDEEIEWLIDEEEEEELETDEEEYDIYDDFSEDEISQKSIPNEISEVDREIDEISKGKSEPKKKLPLIEKENINSTIRVKEGQSVEIDFESVIDDYNNKITAVQDEINKTWDEERLEILRMKRDLLDESLNLAVMKEKNQQEMKELKQLREEKRQRERQIEEERLEIQRKNEERRRERERERIEEEEREKRWIERRKKDEIERKRRENEALQRQLEKERLERERIASLPKTIQPISVEYDVQDLVVPNATAYNKLRTSRVVAAKSIIKLPFNEFWDSAKTLIQEWDDRFYQFCERNELTDQQIANLKIRFHLSYTTIHGLDERKYDFGGKSVRPLEFTNSLISELGQLSNILSGMSLGGKTEGSPKHQALLEQAREYMREEAQPFSNRVRIDSFTISLVARRERVGI